MPDPAYQRHLELAHQLLRQCMGVACTPLAAELARASTPNRALRQVRNQAAAALDRHRALFLADFDDALAKGLVAAAAPPADPATRTFDLEDLEIMDDTRVQEEIEVAHAVQVLGSEVSFEAHRLLRFESALLQVAGLPDHHAGSPVGPPALARALWCASERLGLDVEGRAQTIRAAASWMAPHLKTIYKELLSAGSEREVIGLTRPGHVDIDLSGEPESVPPSGFDVTRPGALFELIGLNDSGEGQDADSRFAPAHTMPMPVEGDDLRIPGLVHGHRDEFDELKASPAADQAQELVTRIFDEILADEHMPAAARLWIGRLLPSVLQVAAQDITLLRSHRHPVWIFINGLTTEMVANGMTPDFERWVANCVARIGTAPSAEMFQTATNGLARKRSSLAQHRLTEDDPALALLQRTAELEVQVGQAQERMQPLLAEAQTPAVVLKFLHTVWSLVCAQEAEVADAGRDSPPGASALAVAGDLIWSADATRSKADAPRIIAMMPVLVDALKRGMAGAGVPDAHRAAWLEQLAEVHLSALKRATGAPARARVEPSAPAEPSPQEGQAGVPAPATEGLPDAAVPSIEVLAALRVGDRLRMQMQGDWVDVQLVWMSDNGRFLMFASTHGSGSHSLTRRSLEGMQAAGLLRVIEERNALERAADGLVRRGKPPA